MGGDLRDQLFLLRLRKVWARRNDVFLWPRKKNVEAMARLGLVMEDVRQICIQLRPSDKIEGPSLDDKGRPGDVWIFHCDYKGVRMYMKFSIVDAEGRDRLTILSCHEEGLR